MTKAKKENIEQVPVLTPDDVQRGLKEANERASMLPRIFVEHMDDIEKFIQAHTDIKTVEEAKEVLAYLDSLKNEWKEYYQIIPSELFPNIYSIIAYAYSVLDDYLKAKETLQECLAILVHSDNYRWLFQIKADLHYKLALCFFHLNDLEHTRSNIKEAVCYQLTRYNNISYNDFSFYAFRPLSKYVLEGIRDNKISLSNPSTFNDPVDPALLSHLSMIIENESDKQEKAYLQLQHEVYERIRITCLSRAQRLPTGEEQPGKIVKDPLFKEINKSTMWGYYANSHKGICIKYVFPSSFTDHEHQKENEVLILRNVEYQPQYDPNRDSFGFTEALFTKSQEWSHEGECRLVYFPKEGKVPDFPWINLPEGCIKEIYIGYSAADEEKRRLMDVLKDKPDIRLFQMQISANNLFELEPIEIKREEYKYSLSTWSKIKSFINSILSKFKYKIQS